MNKAPLYGKALPHWVFGGTIYTFGFPTDGFCSNRKFHVMISKDNIVPGWHMSVRPFCSESFGRDRKPDVGREIWLPDVIAFFKLAGVEWFEMESDGGLPNFYETLGKDI